MHNFRDQGITEKVGIEIIHIIIIWGFFCFFVFVLFFFVILGNPLRIQHYGTHLPEMLVK